MPPPSFRNPLFVQARGALALCALAGLLWWSMGFISEVSLSRGADGFAANPQKPVPLVVAPRGSAKTGHTVVAAPSSGDAKQEGPRGTSPQTPVDTGSSTGIFSTAAVSGSASGPSALGFEGSLESQIQAQHSAELHALFPTPIAKTALLKDGADRSPVPPPAATPHP